MNTVASTPITFTMSFNGREAEVTCTICSPEPDVGILGPYAEEITATYLDDSSNVPNKVVQMGLDRINDRISDIYYSGNQEERDVP